MYIYIYIYICIWKWNQYCCVACGIHKDSTPQKFLDNSHKISRSNYLLRWCEKNAVALCRRCHNDWGAGITKPQNDAIDRMWGDGTVARLEQFAKQYPYSKGSNLDSVDFRMKLESFYRKKLKCLEDRDVLQVWQAYRKFFVFTLLSEFVRSTLWKWKKYTSNTVSAPL